MQRAFIHLTTFSNYRMAICRQKYKVLKSTTMATFFKICPESFIYRHNETDGYTILINKSLIYWMHLDSYDEQDLRGLEINSAVIDQGEEIRENIYLVLDARIGRWDKAQVSNKLLLQQTNVNYYDEISKIKNPKEQRELIEKLTKWPRHPKWGIFLVNNYMDVLCNPSDDDEFHWTFRRYNPKSFERQPNHFYIHRQTDDDLNDTRTIEQIKSRDSEWINKYYYGLTGSPKARIHTIHEDSIIDPDKVIAQYGIEFWNKFLETIKDKAGLYRILDHADTGITACAWEATLNKCHIFYREYYVEATLISANRQNITDLTFDEDIIADYADPDIFKKHRQSEGGFQCVADEYNDEEIEGPPIYWLPADNNELATRNRINELLLLSGRFAHPITRISPAPGIYFIKRTISYPYGCDQIIKQTNAQRRQLIGSDNGKNIYSENRDPNITDHSYDLVRYDIAMHNDTKVAEPRKIPRNSFAYYNAMKKRRDNFNQGLN